MGTRAVWQAVSIILVRRLYMPPEPPGVGGRTARLWLQPTPSTYLYMFFQIRFQTSARRLIRSDLSDGIGRIQIRPHILGFWALLRGFDAPESMPGTLWADAR